MTSSVYQFRPYFGKGDFFGNRSREHLPPIPASWQSLNKFCESVIEIFGDEVSRVINTVKNILLR